MGTKTEFFALETRVAAFAPWKLYGTTDTLAKAQSAARELMEDAFYYAVKIVAVAMVETRTEIEEY